MNLSQYNFIDAIIVRTPAFPIDEYKRSLQGVLDNPYFREAISHASPAVFHELTKMQFDESQLSSKMRFTILKYFNRMCFRSTPFGTMAALSLARFGKFQELIVDHEMILHVLPSFNTTILQAVALLHERMSQEIQYERNKTCYSVGNEIRYVKYRADEKLGRREFFIASAEVTEPLTAILAFTGTRQIKANIIRFAVEQFSVTEAEAQEFVSTLIREQLLTCLQDPNITGMDYMSRICSLTGNPQPDYATTDVPGDSIEWFINSERKILSGSVDDSVQAKIMEGLEVIKQLTAYNESPQLVRFRERFRKRFDGQVVPLMVALDPEIGVGYESLEVAADKPQLIAKSILRRKKNKGHHS